MNRLILSLLITFLSLTGFNQGIAFADKYIRDDATGGDCASIGTWDDISKTCILTTDVRETIQIMNDGITFDGDGRVLAGWWGGNGVLVSGRTDVTLKNLTIVQFPYGILLDSSNNCSISGITAYHNRSGIALNNSNNNIVSGSLIGANHDSGIRLLSSNNNMLRNNWIGNNGNGGIFLSSSSYNIIDNNFVLYHEWWGGAGYGIYSYSSNQNTLTNNTISNNIYYGLQLYDSTNSTIYNNNFVDNGTQVYVSGGSDNVFNLTWPKGGNYWSNFDTSGEGCNDINGNGICDTSYIFTGGHDDFPWAKMNGWLEVKDVLPPTIQITATPSILWPPNKQLVDVKIDGSAIDDMSGVALVDISVLDEYGRYNMVVPKFGSTIQLESWRDGNDTDGRTYTIKVVATDMAGNQATATAQVTVHHDMRK